MKKTAFFFQILRGVSSPGLCGGPTLSLRTQFPSMSQLLSSWFQDGSQLSVWQAEEDSVRVSVQWVGGGQNCLSLI